MTIPVPRCGWASLCSSELPIEYMKTNGYISFINSPAKPIAMNKIILSVLFLGTLIGCQIDDTKNTYTISGRIVWSDNSPFERGLTVTLLKGDEIIATSHDDQFTFSNLEEGGVYTVQPVTDEDGRNGISNLDLVEVRKQIEGIIPFNIFQQVAADVNKDGQITSQDLDIMRNCILSPPKIYECPNYRFVSPEHDDTNFRYIDRFTSTKLYSDQDITFLAIKLGDINGTIHP